MLRAARCHVPTPPVGQLLTALLGLILLLPGSTQANVAAEARAQAQARAGTVKPAGTLDIRAGQIRAERAMRRADRQIKRLQRRQAHEARRLHRATKRLERSMARRDALRVRAETARQRMVTVRSVRDRMLRVHPSPAGFGAADRPQLRHRVKRLKAQVERLEVEARRLARRTAEARRVRQARVRTAGGGRIDARREERERAEGTLAGYIGRMLSLSKARAESAPSSSRRLLRPAKGRISQGYGCQVRGRARNDRSGCRFHDGVDIATRRGARVRASAPGYVAYIGWNPWDHGRRAFVVIVGHAHGIETVYAHLKPVRMVKAGQRVRRGQSIGIVGLTGHTTGPHVHWEVSRDFVTMDPLR